MHQVNIHEAKTNLSKLIEQAVQGEPFIIAKAGKPLVKVTALTPPEPKKTSLTSDSMVAQYPGPILYV